VSIFRKQKNLVKLKAVITPEATPSIKAGSVPIILLQIQFQVSIFSINCELVFFKIKNAPELGNAIFGKIYALSFKTIEKYSVR